VTNVSESYNERLPGRQSLNVRDRWASIGIRGYLRWKDHAPGTIERYPLSHLHPFIQRIELESAGIHSAVAVDLYISFGLHTFTRSIEPYDKDRQFYRDNREIRKFCPERYRRSLELPAIIRTLEQRRCEFARGFNGQVNYVTVETTDGKRYAAFFDLRRFKKVGPHGIHLRVQSAYILDPDKPAPGKGRIHFHALLGHVLRGTRPRRPA
jgi:hypothetical protein